MKTAAELINIKFPYCSKECSTVELLGAGECESVCPSKFNKVLMCVDCGKCYNGCKNAFPEKYIDGGASECEGFIKEEDEEKIIDNLKRKEKEIMEKYAKEGFFV